MCPTPAELTNTAQSIFPTAAEIAKRSCSIPAEPMIPIPAELTLKAKRSFPIPAELTLSNTTQPICSYSC